MRAVAAACAMRLFIASDAGCAADVAAAPGAPTQPGPSGFPSMHYFILDASNQALGARGLAYVNLIGDLAAKRFWVYYEGDVSHLRLALGHRRLDVILKDRSAVVAKVGVMDLSGLRGTVAINRRVIAECAVPMQEVDAVEARIDP